MVGQFRVDWRAGAGVEGEIDVSVSREFRGGGYGVRLIATGVEFASRERIGARLHAFVKPENRASRRAFEAAGFENLGEEDVKGHRAVHYLWARAKA